MEATLYPIWKEAVKAFVAEFTYGAIIPRRWFLEAFEIDVLPAGTLLTEEAWESRNFAWLRSFEPFRQALLEEHKMLLVSIEGRCYMVELPGKQAKRVFKKRSSEAERAIIKMQRGLVNINPDLLTTEEQHELSDIMVKANTLTNHVLSNPTRKRLPYGNEDDPTPAFKKRKGV